MADIDLAKAQALEERYDPELQFRPLSKPAFFISGTFLFLLSVFHYYIAGFGVVRELMLVGIHLSFVLGLIFISFPIWRGKSRDPLPSSWHTPAGVPLYDWILAFGTPVIVMFLPLLPTEIVGMRVGNPDTIDVVIGTALILLVLETTRRTMGIALPLIAITFILYGLYGNLVPAFLPSALIHPGASWTGLVNHLYMTNQGIYGIAVTVVAKYVFLFVVFGVIATRIGLGKLFIDVASLVAGRFAGGPAKVAIFSSAMLGMISGSSIANTVTTGSLTIPAMKRIGYEPHFAGAVEATASTGGQITPPIMGAAAFIMVEYLEIPYRDIIIAASIPAMMHYLGILTMVHLEAKKLGLRGLRSDEMPTLAGVLRDNWMSVFPLGLLIFLILVGHTPDNSAFWGITACIVVGFVNPRNRLTVSDLVGVFRQGAQYALAVGAAAASVGIIVGVVTLTGMGFRLSFMVTQAASEFGGLLAPLTFGLLSVDALTLFLTLVFTAITCIIMGAGIPTTATYIILVTIAAPALGLLNVPPLVAHFFVFYYGVLADITPPVALAAYAGAGIARSNPFRTGNTAFRLASAKALVPFVFVYSPSMLLITDGFTWSAFTVTMVGCVLGILMLGTAMIGFVVVRLNGFERVLMGIASLCLIAPSISSTALGLLIASPVLGRQGIVWFRNRRESAAAAQ